MRSAAMHEALVAAAEARVHCAVVVAQSRTGARGAGKRPFACKRRMK